MAILASIGWIVLGVLYIVYKIGEEKLNLGKSGGIGCVFFAVLFITLFATIANFSEELAGALILAGIFSIPIWALVSSRREKRLQQEKQKELFEIRIIRNGLPMPTHSQMAKFIEDIHEAEEPSKQQLEYREMLRKAEANMPTTPLDANHFKDMQAAWIYYSNNDTHSPERRRIFGEQDLSSKTFFDPSIDRSKQAKTVSHIEIFSEATSNLRTRISLKWCDQPAFARKLFRMIDKSIPLTEETLYPLMLESCVRSSDWTLRWMQDEVNAVRIALLPKMMYVLSQTAISMKETKEWLEVEAFQLYCIQAILEKQFIKNEDLFPVLLKIYDDLLEKEFSHQPQKRNFVALWNGLNSAGKAVGKEGSFFDYPKYTIKQSKEANHDHQ